STTWGGPISPPSYQTPGYDGQLPITVLTTGGSSSGPYTFVDTSSNNNTAGLLTDLNFLTGYKITIVGEQSQPSVSLNDHLKLWIGDEGINYYKGMTYLGSIFDSSAVTIENYTTVDIYLPFE